MIAIVNYGRGNLGSVRKALARVSGEVVITEDPRVVERAVALVVPGDGAFADAMQRLERLGLLDPIRAHIGAGRPYLGICLGYQLLFTASEEFGHAKGLDILPGLVRRFPTGLPGGLPTGHSAGLPTGHSAGLPTGHSAGLPTGHSAGLPTGHSAGLKVPHMGWNQVRIGDRDRSRLPVFDGVPDGAYFYFVHSYYPDPVDLAGAAVATCEYGVTFPAALVRGALVGTQFHPEKSQRWGLRVLDNFAARCQG